MISSIAPSVEPIVFLYIYNSVGVVFVALLLFSSFGIIDRLGLLIGFAVLNGVIAIAAIPGSRWVTVFTFFALFLAFAILAYLRELQEEKDRLDREDPSTWQGLKNVLPR